MSEMDHIVVETAKRTFSGAAERATGFDAGTWSVIP
jgi:hypothetical protein